MGIIAVTVLYGAILLFLNAIGYLSTEFVDDGVSQTDNDFILTSLENRWNLAVMKGATDLPKIFVNERISRIEFRRSVIQHAEVDPQQGLVIRVWGSSLAGSIERRFFILLQDADGQPRLNALSTRW